MALILSSAAINAAFHKTGDAILNMIVKTVQMKFDVHFTPAVTMNLGVVRVDVSTVNGCVMVMMTVGISPMNNIVSIHLAEPTNSSVPLVNVFRTYGNVMDTGIAKMPPMSRDVQCIPQMLGDAYRNTLSATTQCASIKFGYVMERMTVEMEAMNLRTSAGPTDVVTQNFVAKTTCVSRNGSTVMELISVEMDQMN